MTAVLEGAVNDLTTQTTNLIEVCSTIKNDVAADIASAVVASENAALIPLANSVTNSITIGTILINVLSTMVDN
jgi:hypothetical protein